MYGRSTIATKKQFSFLYLSQSQTCMPSIAHHKTSNYPSIRPPFKADQQPKPFNNEQSTQSQPPTLQTTGAQTQPPLQQQPPPGDSQQTSPQPATTTILTKNADAFTISPAGNKARTSMGI